MKRQTIAILDFGSQYAQLIARRVRDNHVFSILLPPTTTASQLRDMDLAGVILSGGPASVYQPGAPKLDPAILDLGVPVLGICYGMQLICHALGGDVQPGSAREYGRMRLALCAQHQTGLLARLPETTTVWMSHGDLVARAGDGFEPIAHTDTCPLAAVAHRDRPLYGLQFHPEVSHTPEGEQILRNFLYDICACRGDWVVGSVVEQALTAIRQRVGNARVLCGISGGVDSSVAAALIHRAIGEQLVCVFVDNGLLRFGERAMVEQALRDHLHIPLVVVDATDRFLEQLAGVSDPQEKRRRIGHEFIEVFRAQARALGAGQPIRFLAQGTLYPDVIESGHSVGGHAANIKLHHNVGGLPAELGFELVEPLRELFKDEVRRIGEFLGLDEQLVWRHPFPGPGLAVRILGDVTAERLATLRQADRILLEELRAAQLYRKTSQTFAVLLPIQSVGVMGDGRTYENVCCIRSVDSLDFMTADWSRLPHELLANISNRIINEVRGINRVVYDISSKPPATIEWE